MISFVVQGPTNYKSEVLFVVNYKSHTAVEPGKPFTSQDCVNSIREHYPDSEIILSCTTGDAEEITNVDRVVYTTDDMLDYDDNVNRQILSSQAVKYAKNDIVCKIRSDVVVTSNALAPYIKKLNDGTPIAKRLDSHKMFSDYVFISNWSADKNHYYHPSDFFFLGHKEDVVSIFDIPQRKEHSYEGNRKWKVGPEQYINLKCMENHGLQEYIDYEWLENNGSDFTHLNKNIPPKDFFVENWWKVFYNNYYILNLGEQAGLFSRKYPERVFCHPNLVNHEEWKSGHKKYIE